MEKEVETRDIWCVESDQINTSLGKLRSWALLRARLIERPHSEFMGSTLDGGTEAARQLEKIDNDFRGELTKFGGLVKAEQHALYVHRRSAK